MSPRLVFSAILLAIFLALMLMGCGGRYAMSAPEMHLAPALEKLPEKFWVATYEMNSTLDLAEGMNDILAWPAVFWDKTGKGSELLALSLSRFGVDKQLLIVIPKENIIGGRVAVFDHCNEIMYNHNGEARLVGASRKGLVKSFSGKVYVDDYTDFLPELSPELDFVREVHLNSEEFESIKQLYYTFRIKDLETSQKYVYKTYGSNLTARKLDQLAKQDTLVRGLVDWLTRDVKIYPLPLSGIGNMLLMAGALKLMTLPSIRRECPDRPGYMKHRPNAGEVAEMIQRAIEDYDKKRRQEERLDLELNRKEESE